MKTIVSILTLALLSMPVYSIAQAEEPEFDQETVNEVEVVANANDDPEAAEQPEAEIAVAEEGFTITNTNLNEVFMWMARNAGLSYFHNNAIDGQEFNVTGHIRGENWQEEMEALAFLYNLELYYKARTLYVLTDADVSQLPQSEWHYQLRYLRPGDIEQIRTIIQPLLTPGTGVVNYEPKTNTLLVIDTPKRIETISNFMGELDRPKGQIIIETKILRVTSSSASRLGVNWAQTLGESGLDLSAIQNLNSLFNLQDVFTENIVRTVTDTSGTASGFGTGLDGSRLNLPIDGVNLGGLSVTSPAGPAGGQTRTIENINTITKQRTAGSGLVLDPVQLNAVMRALNSGNLASQKSNPTLITEDNEQATISIIDRVPIITTTITTSTATTNITEEVRYRIDESDPVGDPATTREIGVTVAVTPSLLPDNTIRMQLRPRTAQIVEMVPGQTQNQYPRVTESAIETLARVPNGHSLLIGGFYDEVEQTLETKVPLLGDIPILNFFFRSKQDVKEQTSLVFIITPTSYDPASVTQNLSVSDQLVDRLDLRKDHDHINPNNPGRAHEPNLRRTLRGILMHPGESLQAPEPLPNRGPDPYHRPTHYQPTHTPPTSIQPATKNTQPQHSPPQPDNQTNKPQPPNVRLHR